MDRDDDYDDPSGFVDADGVRRPTTRREEKSIWFARAVVGQLVTSPSRVLATARSNIERWRAQNGQNPYLDEWERIIDNGIDAVIDVLTRRDERCHDLRKNGPFPGVLSEETHLKILRAFRRYWNGKAENDQ